MISYIEYLNVPTKIAMIVVGLFLILQIIGELLELKGKIVPEFVKIRKYFSRKKKERKDTSDTLKDVKRFLGDAAKLLGDVNNHYSEDNIKKRDDWIKWVNDRADVYDKSIVDISNKLGDAIKALNDNTKMTEEMFIQSSRDRIIDFANRVVDESAIVSREEYNRIFKVYDKYENFLKERKLKNGEVAIAIQVIKESYETHMKHHTFLEDVRGYK